LVPLDLRQTRKFARYGEHILTCRNILRYPAGVIRRSDLTYVKDEERVHLLVLRCDNELYLGNEHECLGERLRAQENEPPDGFVHCRYVRSAPMILIFRVTARLEVFFAAGLAILSVASLVALTAVPVRADTGPSPGRQTELRNLLVQDCGSCHGLTLRGGLGPSLQGQALAGKPAEYLAATILFGRPGTAMPPWRPFLSDTEAAWLASILKQQAP
jgi:cytochrome c55X